MEGQRMAQYNTIILKKGVEKLSQKEKQTYKKGDLIYGKRDKPPVELKRWTLENEKKAEIELEKYFCWMDSSIFSGKVFEYALVYCQTDENGEVIKELEYKFARENKEWNHFVEEHYNIQIGVSTMRECDGAFECAIKELKKEGLSFKVLPLCQSYCNSPIEMIEYETERGIRYCVTWREWYYIMVDLPFDGDYSSLIEDVNDQINHDQKPQKMMSKFRKLVKNAEIEAFYMKLSETEEKLLAIYRKRVIDQNLAEERTDWDADDPVDEAANEILRKRRIAGILYHEGYCSYCDMEFLAQFDTEENLQMNRLTLKELKVGYDEFLRQPYWGIR